MPVARYFLFVGGVLLALLFIADAYTPQQVVVASTAAPSIDKSTVRIRSDQKLPERVVYDTSLPTIVPPAATVQAAAMAPVPASEATAQARIRDTFAQFVPADAKRKLEKPEPPAAQAPRKHKTAKANSNKSNSYPPIRVAQQSQAGFFGMPRWNNTW